MEMRYQVFVSSTYADLQEERQKVIQTLMEMDCIPAGMELFPAADEEQWKFIQRVIDDCDYYILIIGGRYGTLTDEGISYTEKEYDYAISIGLKVLAFVHSRPNNIPLGKSEKDSEARKKLDKFRERVSTNRLVKMWSSANGLPGLVALSLSKTIKIYPAVGWVRATNVASGELLTDLNELRKENANLKEQILEQSAQSEEIDDVEIAALDDIFTVRLRWRSTNRYGSKDHVKEIDVAWREIFERISPDLQSHPSDKMVNSKLGESLYRIDNPNSTKSIKVDHDDFDTIRIQLIALGLIDTPYTRTIKGNMALFWGLTKKGEKIMMNLRTVKESALKSNLDKSESI